MDWLTSCMLISNHLCFRKHLIAAYYIGINSSASTVMGTDICAEIHENILEIYLLI